MNETVGSRIKQLRTDHDLTLKQLSEFTNIRKSALSKYENSVNKPSFDAIVSLCEFFNLHSDWLLTGEGDRYKSIVDIEFEATEDITPKSTNQITPEEIDLVIKLRQLTPRQQGIIAGRIDQAYDDLQVLSKTTKKQTSYHSDEEAATNEKALA